MTTPASAYSPLSLDGQPDDGRSLTASALARYALLQENWRPYHGDPIVAVLGVGAQLCADLRALARDSTDGNFAGEGRTLLQIPQIAATAATLPVTFTTVDDAGYTVPAGTPVSWSGSPSGLTFTLNADLVIPNGDTTGTGACTASVPGVVGNEVPDGVPLELEAALAFVTDTVAAADATGGADAETDDAYRSRLSLEARTLQTSPSRASDYAALALNIPGVARCLVLPLYDADTDTADVPGAITLLPLTATGEPVASGVADAVQAAMSAETLRGLNVNVFTAAPHYSKIATVSTVIVDPTADSASVLAAAEAAVLAYTGPATWDPTQTLVRRLDVARVIGDVAGVLHVVTLTLNAGTADIDLTHTPVGMPAGAFASAAWTGPSTAVVTAA